VSAPRNEVCLSGTLVARDELRFTPAGVPVLEFRIRHASRQTEAGLARQVECELGAVALGPAGRLIAAAPFGIGMTVTGFLAARSARSRTPVLHVSTIEFVEGTNDGIQIQEAAQQA
jgi:primosomal replication protein N